MLSLQDVSDVTYGDVIEWRAPGVGQGECIVPAESFIYVQGYFKKTVSAPMSDLAVIDEQITTNLGFPNTQMFQRLSLSYNNTQVNTEFQEMEIAEFVDTCVNRPNRSIAAEGSSGGWYWDELDTSPGASVTVGIHAAAADGTTAANAALSVTNSEQIAAGLVPSSNGRVGAAGTSPNIAGDLRCGLRCRIFAVGGTGAAAFNTKYLGIEMVITQAGIAAGGAQTDPYLAPTADDGTGTVTFQLCATQDGKGFVQYADTNNCILTIVVYPDEIMMCNMSQRNPALLPLGMNKGAKARRQRFLAGGAFGTGANGAEEKYYHFSVAIRPFASAWRDCRYLPPDVTTMLRATLGKKDHFFRDYSRRTGGSSTGPAADNLDLKLTKCSLMLKRLKFSPQVDAALTQRYADGGMVRINNGYVRQYTQRFDSGTTQFTLRSFLQGPRGYRYVLWTAEDAVTTQAVKQAGSSVDLTWESGGQDVSELYMLIGGSKVYPHRRLDINTAAKSVIPMSDKTTGGTAGASNTRSSADTAVPLELLRRACADSTDPIINSQRWEQIKLYVFETSLIDANSGAVDPIQENSQCEVRLTLNKPTTTPRIIGVVAYNHSCITIDATGVVTNDMN